MIKSKNIPNPHNLSIVEETHVPETCMAWGIVFIGPVSARELIAGTIRKTRRESIATMTDDPKEWRAARRSGKFRCVPVCCRVIS